jgi:galactokinase
MKEPVGSQDFSILSYHLEEYQEQPGAVVSAPGVGFLLGEHSEFCNGMAIGFGLPLRTYVAVSKRNDSSLRFYAKDLDERKRSTLSNLKFKREDRWANYLKGVLVGLDNAGCPMSGLNITFMGTIPLNKGLFSSGSLCLALAKAIALAQDHAISDPQLIQAVLYAEKHFVQSPYVSPLEIYVSLYAKPGQLLIIDQRNFSLESIPVSFPEYSLLLIDTQIPQSDFLEDLQERIEVCSEAADVIRKQIPIGDLRSISPKEFRGILENVSESVRRISIHGINENVRFHELMTHLKSGNLEAIAKILNRSQEDLRDLFEVSCPEIDWIAKHTVEIPGVLCTRLTGVGIASCAFTIYEKKSEPELLSRLEDYERIFGFHPIIYPVRLSNGLEVHRIIPKGEV